MSEKLNFWIAGPQHVGDPRPVIYQKTTLANPEILSDNLPSKEAIENEVAFWMPQQCAVGTRLNSETLLNCAFLANRAYFDDNNDLYIYQEPYGKWNTEFAKAMKGLRLVKMGEGDNSYLINQGEIDNTLNFDGWKITKWTVERRILTEEDILGIEESTLTTDTPLIWDVIIWEKDINGVTIKVTARHGWPLY